MCIGTASNTIQASSGAACCTRSAASTPDQPTHRFHLRGLNAASRYRATVPGPGQVRRPSALGPIADAGGRGSRSAFAAYPPSWFSSKKCTDQSRASRQSRIRGPDARMHRLRSLASSPCCRWQGWASPHRSNGCPSTSPKVSISTASCAMARSPRTCCCARDPIPASWSRFPPATAASVSGFRTDAMPVTWTMSRTAATAHHPGRARTIFVRHHSRSRRIRRSRTCPSSRPCYPASACLRDYQALGTVPDEVAVQPDDPGLDHHLGARSPRRRGRIPPQHRRSPKARCRTIASLAGSDGKIGLKITAVSGETPLTPLAGEHLLNDRAASRRRGSQCAHFPELSRKNCSPAPGASTPTSVATR